MIFSGQVHFGQPYIVNCTGCMIHHSLSWIQAHIAENKSCFEYQYNYQGTVKTTNNKKDSNFFASIKCREPNVQFFWI